MFELFGVCIFGGIVLLPILLSTVRILMEYQRGIVFRFGKFLKVANPGINILIPFVDSMRIVDMRIQTCDIPKQEVMTKDNVPVNVNGVIYLKIIDPKKAVLQIKDYYYAVMQYGQTALRDVIGNKDLDDVLSNREAIAQEIEKLVDEEVADWGIDITAIKIQDIELPSNMKRAMARQAEAEREKRGTIIKSEGEIVAAKNLQKAADILAKDPAAIHLRTLQTISDISTDPSNKLIFFLPMETMDIVREIVKTKKK